MIKKVTSNHVNVSEFMFGNSGNENNSPNDKANEVMYNLEVATDDVKEVEQELSKAMVESVQRFKFETVKKDGTNERRIAGFKLKMEDAKKEFKAKHIQKAHNMDIRNSFMRMRIEGHEVLENEQWDIFMFGFNKDMGKLEEALKANMSQ